MNFNKPGCTAAMKMNSFVFNGEYVDLDLLGVNGLNELRVNIEDVISDIEAQIEYVKIQNEKEKQELNKEWAWRAYEALRINKRMLERVKIKIRLQ
jgi:hypothetical protein